jgi:hypothetical protein
MKETLRAECRLCSQIVSFTNEGFLIFGDKAIDEKVLIIDYKDKHFIVCPDCRAVIFGIISDDKRKTK